MDKVLESKEFLLCAFLFDSSMTALSSSSQDKACSQSQIYHISYNLTLLIVGVWASSAVLVLLREVAPFSLLRQ